MLITKTKEGVLLKLENKEELEHMIGVNYFYVASASDTGKEEPDLQGAMDFSKELEKKLDSMKKS